MKSLFYLYILYQINIQPLGKGYIAWCVVEAPLFYPLCRNVPKRYLKKIIATPYTCERSKGLINSQEDGLQRHITKNKKEVELHIRNPGKIFEDDFIKSVPDYCWHKRLNDNAASWGEGNKTRFASTNECDFLLYDCKSRTLSALELKSTQSSLTFWRKDFEDDGLKHSFNIKKGQILGLKKWSKFLMNCGFVFNFRNNENRTLYVYIIDFLNYTSVLNKKSINMNDVLQMNPKEIENTILRTHYRYNLDEFLKEIQL